MMLELSQTMADELLKRDPMLSVFLSWRIKDKAKLECSYLHTHKEHLDKAIAAFIEVGLSLNVVE
jgi:glycine C-acetyltransferase